jgi:N-acetyl-anhydromuramyl-L-alanine amidase AmpD
MIIIEKTYKWNGVLVRRPKTNYIILHHAAGSTLSPDDIHRIHQGNGWSGIGYHFYVRKDGSIYRGRPINSTGAHVSNYNSQCLGICFEGNFEKEQMPEAQLNAGKELIAYVRGLYPNALIRKHKDLNATACPGRYFPFDEISNAL